MAGSSTMPDDENHSRKRRLSDEDQDNVFTDFRIIKVLHENAQQKSIFLHGRFGSAEEDAVLILEKTPFSEKSVAEMLKAKHKVKSGMLNDVYKTLEVFPSHEFNGLKTTLIHPATAKHLSKYSSHACVLVNETPEDYKNLVVPYIESSSFSRQWVFNILEKRSETERILFEDDNPSTGFMLLPDMKWDGNQVEDLYMVAFAMDRTLRCIRDLSSAHIPLLKNMRDQGKAVIKAKFGVPESCLRLYLHYVPSYYHLHVHFTHLNYDAPGIFVGRAHLLDDVINNLELMSDYYQRATLTYVLRENDELYRCYKDAGKMNFN